MRKNNILIVILSLIMLGAVIYGISESGSPFTTRAKKIDQIRISNMQSIQTAINSYYTTYRRLPKNLDEMRNDASFSYVKNSILDPESNQEYTYTIKGVTEYQLCDTFSAPSDSSQGVPTYAPYGYQSWDHQKGYHCFDLQIPTTVLQSTANDPLTLKLYGTPEARDAVRMADLNRLQTAINTTIQQASTSGAALMCDGKPYPCGGSSQRDGNAGQGHGWVKINLGYATDIPVDTLENATYHYAYCATDKGWEIDAVFESSQYQTYMRNDGGDDLTKYEIGSNLSLIDKTPGCTF